MEAMATDETDQDHRHKSGREEREETVQEQIRELRGKEQGKEQEIRELRGDIRELREEIREKEQNIIEVEHEIANASGTEGRKLLQAKLEFLRQQISSRDQQISSLHQQISSRDQQISSLRQQIISLRSLQHAAASAGLEDRPGEWIKHMLLPPLTELPQNERDLGKVLFPEQPGKLPVHPLTYHAISGRQPDVARKFLILADPSRLSVLITQLLNPSPGPMYSEMNVSSELEYIFNHLFFAWRSYSSCAFPYKLLFNCCEKTGDSLSGSTKSRSRPDTLLTASGCTFLVGEDKYSSITAARSDLEGKMQPLSPMFYGEVQFILGYVAGGSEFQWVYIGKNGKISSAGSRLDLSTDSGRCQLFLSIGYAYQLIRKMVDTVPEVPGRRAMFTKDVAGDREIYFYSDSVRKYIKNFSRFCEDRMTGLEEIMEAYGAGERAGCSSLPRLVVRRSGSGPRLINKERVLSRDTYTADISPLGYSPTLSSEQDLRMLAKNVCEALSVLHEAGLVHRDVRYPNVVQVSKEQFVLIDLETVAVFPFQVPEGFKYFSGWSDGMLEGKYYTPMSDMYQLGRLLEDRMPGVTFSSTSALLFIRKLKQKEYTAVTALGDPWLSDPI